MFTVFERRDAVPGRREAARLALDVFHQRESGDGGRCFKVQKAEDREALSVTLGRYNRMPLPWSRLSEI